MPPGHSLCNKVLFMYCCTQCCTLPHGCPAAVASWNGLVDQLFTPFIKLHLMKTPKGIREHLISVCWHKWRHVKAICVEQTAESRCWLRGHTFACEQVPRVVWSKVPRANQQLAFWCLKIFDYRWPSWLWCARSFIMLNVSESFPVRRHPPQGMLNLCFHTILLYTLHWAQLLLLLQTKQDPVYCTTCFYHPDGYIHSFPSLSSPLACLLYIC